MLSNWWCWRRLLRVPWTARRSNQSILKEINMNIHQKDWWGSWNSNTLATWCEEPTHWNRPWCWERLEAKGKGGGRAWASYIAPPTQWTWVWVNSGRWWRTGRPGMLQFMGHKELDTTQQLNKNNVCRLVCNRCYLSTGNRTTVINLSYKLRYELWNGVWEMTGRIKTKK